VSLSKSGPDGDARRATLPWQAATLTLQPTDGKKPPVPSATTFPGNHAMNRWNRALESLTSGKEWGIVRCNGWRFPAGFRLSRAVEELLQFPLQGLQVRRKGLDRATGSTLQGVLLSEDGTQPLWGDESITMQTLIEQERFIGPGPPRFQPAGPQPAEPRRVVSIARP
jgi:hypothetical protein